MANIPLQNRRPIAAAAPPPPPQDEQQQSSLYDYIWACVTSIDPSFNDQGPNETDDQFLNRIVTFIAPDGGMPEEKWNDFDVEAQAWYTNAAEAIEQGNSIPPPDGFYAAPDEQQVQQEQPAPTKGAVPSGLAAYQQRQREAKAAANASNGQTQQYAGNGQAGPARMAPRNTAAPAAPAAPSRRAASTPIYTPPQPAPMQQRRTAPAPQPQQQGQMQRRQPPAPAAAPPQEQRQQSTRAPRRPDAIDDLRYQVICNPEISQADLINYARQQDYPQADSSIGAVMSQTRSVLAILDAEKRLLPVGGRR